MRLNPSAGHEVGADPRDSRDRWLVAAAAIQAVSTFGMFVVALIGIWNVQPIITYQLERQEREQRQAQALPFQGAVRAETAAAAVFVDEIASWWRERTEGYERILELIRQSRTGPTRVSFEIVEYPGLLPDTTEPRGGLLVTATHSNGEVERVRVAVNAAAVSPAQYIQYRLNHGAFSSLSQGQRQAVETAVAAYIQRFMMPVPPLLVGPTMTLDDLYTDIDSARARRLDAAQDIDGLAMVIDAVLTQAASAP